MRIYNVYIILLALFFMLTTFILSLSDQSSWDLYFSLYLIVYLIFTLLFTYLNPRARRLSNVTGYLLFAGFALIVASKVLSLLGVLP